MLAGCAQNSGLADIPGPKFNGPVIAKGTVVVRNGLIEAVGENVAVPADALVVEGEGLTVYPGLIDSLSTVGQPNAAPAAAMMPVSSLF